MKLFKKELYIIGNRPQTDWRRVFFVSIILTLGFSVYGFIFYREISAQSANVESVIVIESSAVLPSDSKDAKLEINETIELYLQKQERFEKMVGELKKS